MGFPRAAGLGVLVLALSTAVASALAYRVARLGEPTYDGRLDAPGLSAPVRVDFGPHAVPSLQAERLDDLCLAHGYVVASERLWQMDLLRRLGRGRLAEIFGPRALGTDRLLRAMGLGRAAEAGAATVEGPASDCLHAYVRGVNLYRERAVGRLPLEYRLLFLTPEPWAAADSMAVLEYMQYMLSFNARQELAYLRFAERVGAERARELLPLDEGVPASPAPPELADALGKVAGVASEVQTLLAALSGGGASNAWAVDGRRTASGYSLLANDPHLAPTAPSVWYELELEAPGFHVAGITVPGVPFVLVGHNEQLAWALTTTMADTQDLFLERLTADGGAVARPGGRDEPIVATVEGLRVRGGPTEQLTLRRTSNGVVLNDVLAHARANPLGLPPVETPYLLTLKSNIDVPDATLEGLYRLAVARDTGEVRGALARARRASQTVLYAHRDGGTGWVATGALPRRRGSSGAFPTPAWVPGYGWDGHHPAAANPYREGPGPAGHLVTANHRTVPLDYPVPVSAGWMPPYRAERIEELLAGRDTLTPEDLVAMQLDQVAPEARRYQVALRRLETSVRAVDPEAWRIAERYLLNWDARFEAGSPSAAFLVLLRPRLAGALYGDELGDTLPDLLALSSFAHHALGEAVASGNSTFWDDVTTAPQEGPAEVWARALRAAGAELERRFPGGQGARLDRVRRLVFLHAFHWLPIAGRLFDVEVAGAGGDDQTVNVLKASLRDPGEALFVASYRVVFTPGDWPETRGTNALGQSGHRLSPYRADQVTDWVAGHTHRWPWGAPAPPERLGRLILSPP